jgi:hypothetical protein
VDASQTFDEEFHRTLALFKYTKWAANLTREQLLVVLWAVGEWGGRGQPILEHLERHAPELGSGYGYPRARVGLQVLNRMVRGEQLTGDEMSRLIEEARKEMEWWPGTQPNTKPVDHPS